MQVNLSLGRHACGPVHNDLIAIGQRPQADVANATATAARDLREDRRGQRLFLLSPDCLQLPQKRVTVVPVEEAIDQASQVAARVVVTERRSPGQTQQAQHRLHLPGRRDRGRQRWQGTLGSGCIQLQGCLLR